MRRYWALVLAVVFAWLAFASCSLEIGDVRQKAPIDAAAEADGSDAQAEAEAEAEADADDSGVYVLPAGCVDPSKFLAHCDPFTNEGCFGGLACDVLFDVGWRLECLSTNAVTEGGTCNNATGPYCAPKLTCSGSPGVCSKFCCTATDCANALCIPFDPQVGTLGFCSTQPADSGP